MGELVKIKAQKAEDLLKHFELNEESEGIPQPGMTTAECLGALIEKQCYADAVKLLAHGLPKREAVWWACLATKGSGDTLDENNTAALHAAELWVREPTEVNRKTAKVSGEKTGNRTAAGWAATAACWSAGSMAPEGEAHVPPPPFLYAHAVAGSVSLAAVLPDPDKAEEKYLFFIKQGLDLASGGRGEVNAA